MSRMMLLGAGGPLAAALLLDGLSGSASAAYSTRKLRTAYPGSCIRVRRSSDNTEQDIGFSSNYLDTSSLTSFVGANDGFIVKWYDQSGNAVDAVQSTAANQPKIVNSGSVYTIGTRPSSAILFVRSSSHYLTLGQTMNSNDVSKSYVTKLVTTNGQAYSNFNSAGFIAGCDSLYNGGTGARRHFQYHGSPDFNTKTITSATTRSTATVYLEMFQRNHSSGKTLKFWLNGSADANNTTYTQTGAIGAGAGAMALGRSGDYNGDYLDGYLSEMMFFGSALSNADLNTIGNSQSTEFGPSWTTI